MKTFIVVLTIQFIASTTFAQIPGLDVSNTMQNNFGSEYFVGRIEGKPLITVNLVGGVRFPGVYHIPIQTDLTQLFSYAGGVVDNADLTSIHLRNVKGNQISSHRINAKDLFSDNKTMPAIQDQDTILVETKSDPLVAASLWIGILSGVAGIVLSTLLITRTR
ncbi:MAG: SLBB domain-containing protein [Oligoflexia bacterium]|nr:SLBB domain-containing protein [Oligoflexia bacterium]